MSSTFSGISTALNALMAQRTALNVTGQNIANANTVGYTRQRANLVAINGSGKAGLFTPTETVGWGVKVDSVTRLADAFVDARQRDAHASASYASTQSTALSQVESIVGEPSDTGLSAQLAKFWSSWQTLANAPDVAAARQAVIGQAGTVVGALRDARAAVGTAYNDTRNQLTAVAAQVNAGAAAIASLNDQIRVSSINGNQPNELMDQRDQIVLQLSGLVGATSHVQDDGSVNVDVGGSTLVAGSRANSLSVQGGETLDLVATSPLRLVWSSGNTASIGTGQVGGLVTALTQTYPDAAGIGTAQGYDDVAAALISTVNTLHATGQDQDGQPGGAFFTGSTAADISVAVTDARKVAAAAFTGTNNPDGTVTPSPSTDGSLADAISQLATAAAGPTALWARVVSAIGVKSASAQTQASVKASVSTQADAARDSASGVSIDEEMTNMLMYQHAYEGAARVMTAIDSMLDTLVNRTGLVGR